MITSAIRAQSRLPKPDEISVSGRSAALTSSTRESRLKMGASKDRTASSGTPRSPNFSAKTVRKSIVVSCVSCIRFPFFCRLTALVYRLLLGKWTRRNILLVQREWHRLWLRRGVTGRKTNVELTNGTVELLFKRRHQLLHLRDHRLAHLGIHLEHLDCDERLLPKWTELRLGLKRSIVTHRRGRQHLGQP